jgi:branched-chain amino acid transport system ATP-binding protein
VTLPVPPALELRDVRAGYGRIEVLHGIDITVPAGSVVALLGPNGVGKTTTLRAISGTLPVRSGRILLDGRRIENRRPSTIAKRGLVLVPEGRGIFPSLTVLDNLRIAHRGAPADAAGPWDAWFEEIVTIFPRLGERLSQLAGSLSGGEQQMLAVCRALVGHPRVVLFDELSMGLAPLIVAELFERVAALRDAGRTIVLVEQYVTYALELADVCYVLAKGRVAWAGEPSELRHRHHPELGAFGVA